MINLLLPPPKRWLWISLGAGIGVMVLVAGASWHYLERERGRLLPGISILNIRLDGLTLNEAHLRMQQMIEERHQEPLSFIVEGRPIPMPWRGANGHELVRYDVEAALNQALAMSERAPLWQRLTLPLALRIRPHNFVPPIEVDRNTIQQTLEQHLQDLLVTPKDADLQIHVVGNSAATVTIEPERVGHRLDSPSLWTALDASLKSLDVSPIALTLTNEPPRWNAQDLTRLPGEVPTWLSHAPFTLETEGQRHPIDRATLAHWLQVTSTNEGPTLALDPERVQQRLRVLLSDFLKEPREGNLEFEGDKIKIFEAPEEGIEVDAEDSINTLLIGFEQNSSTIALTLRHRTTAIHGEAAERLGIHELLGVGRSNFSGSPVNRRKNIALGATKVNFSLIKPGEEFSLLKALGKIDEPGGWLPELVIKGNKTTPEFGGGLCQIGTTTFRAALASGLPITERRNHSYRVRYYEPAGTDATIYDPAPDMKFKNDTLGWILITTRVKGDALAFTLWGTRDGRIASQTTPVISNVVPPPEKKIVETLDLPVGKTKCTETAHAGADARFEYTISYPNGEIKKTPFYSHYKPWQAVCLFGVTHLSTTSTPPIDQTGLNNPNL